MKTMLLILGILAVLMGLLWIGQGTGLVGPARRRAGDLRGRAAAVFAPPPLISSLRHCEEGGDAAIRPARWLESRMLAATSGSMT